MNLDDELRQSRKRVRLAKRKVRRALAKLSSYERHVVLRLLGLNPQGIIQPQAMEDQGPASAQQ